MGVSYVARIPITLETLWNFCRNIVSLIQYKVNLDYSRFETLGDVRMYFNTIGTKEKKNFLEVLCGISDWENWAEK